MSAKVYIFLANGFETTEALTVLDILRRGEVEVKTISVTQDLFVTSSHNVVVKADELFENVNFEDAFMLLLPGGMPGATNLNSHTLLGELLKEHALSGKKIGAICAAPMVLGGLGLLNNHKATCYPGFETYLTGATYTANLVTIDKNIITGKGPAATMEYAFTLLEIIKGKEKANAVKNGMLYNELF